MHLAGLFSGRRHRHARHAQAIEERFADPEPEPVELEARDPQNGNILSAILGDLGLLPDDDDATTTRRNSQGGRTSVSVIYVTAPKTFDGPAIYVTQGDSRLSSYLKDKTTTTTKANKKTTSTSEAKPTSTKKSVTKSTESDTESIVSKTTSAAVLSTSASSTLITSQPTITQARSTAEPSAEPTPSSGGMSGGAKAGLAFGIIALVALIGAVGFFLYRKKKLGQDSSYDEKATPQNPFADPPTSAAPPISGPPPMAAVAPPPAPVAAPQVSLRPVTQFDPNLPGVNGANAQGGNVGPNGTDRSLAPDAQNPFGNHAATSQKPVSAASFNLPIQGLEGAAAVAGGAAVGAAGAAAVAAAHPRPPAIGTPKASSIQSVDGVLQAPPTPGTPGYDSDSSSVFGVPAVATTAAAIPVAALAANAQKPRPNGTVHRVQMDFKPSMEDELPLSAGQLVRVLHEYDDGWALCVFMNGSKQGVVPRSCLSKTPVKPRAGPPPNGPPRGPPPQNPQNGAPRGPPPQNPQHPRPTPAAFPHPPSGRNSPGPIPGAAGVPRPLTPGGGRNSPGPFPGAAGIPRPLTPGSGRNSPGPLPAGRPMSPAGRPHGRSQSPGPQHMAQRGPPGPRPRANSNAGAFQAYQPGARSMSPGPYGGGPVPPRPIQEQRPRSNSASQVAPPNFANGPGPSPMNPISALPTGGMPQRKPVPGAAM